VSVRAAQPGLFLEQPVEVFRKQMELNYFGCVHIVKASVPRLIELGVKGHVVIVSSALALFGFSVREPRSACRAD
jgi:NAD(P)-dependent dehydrogenase (short-subunit alcohol dehydrogenase family)